MSDIWYKDSETGRIYQDRTERGKTVRYVRDDPQEQSTGREGAGRDLQPSRARRNSVISSGPTDSRPSSRYQAQRGASTKREPSIRPDGSDPGRNRVERSETVRSYTSHDRRLPDDHQSTYGEGQAGRGHRDSKRYYDSPGGHNPPQIHAAAVARDSVDGLERGLQDLSVAADYSSQAVVPLPSARATYPSPAAYNPPSAPVVVDYAPITSAQTAGNSGETTPIPRQIRGTPHLGESEKLDHTYKMRNRDYKDFFQVGRVFSTLWTEGAGNYIDDKDKTFVSEVIYKERVHSKIRRFVVVRVGDRSVWCLPVTSYGGAGPRKREILLHEHGFIYSKATPKKVDGILFRPLKVVLSKSAQSKDLTDPSLINYGKVYTVETNVKVKDVGDLDRDSKSDLARYFKRVMEGGESALPPEIDDTPRQSNAILAHVGGAAQNLSVVSQINTAVPVIGYPLTAAYNIPTNHDPTRGYGSPSYGYGTGYSATQDTQAARYGYPPPDPSHWQVGGSDMPTPPVGYGTQPPSTYPNAMAIGYTTTSGYGAARASDYNTNPSYYAQTPYLPDARHNSLSSYKTSEYDTPAMPRTSDTQEFEYLASINPHRQPSESEGFGRGGGGEENRSTARQTYMTGPGERADDIRLPTLEEASARRRRDSDAAPRERRRRR